MDRKNMFLCIGLVLLIVSVFLTGLGQQAQAKDEMIKIASSQEPMALDPTHSTSGNDSIIFEEWTERLAHRDTSGKIVPGVIASWKVSPDGKKIECTLREGVKFHSGDLLTAKDIKFSLEIQRKMNRSVRRRTASIKEVEIIDDYHFNFIMKAADVTLIPKRFHFHAISKSYYDRVGEETFAKQPVGTGPYKFLIYKPGQYIEIERFEEYWGKKPPIKRARIYFVGSGVTRIAKLKTGEVDFIQGIPYPQVKQIEEDPNLKVIRLETNHPTRSILMGSKNPNKPWYDKRVRMAMALAIDQFSIIKNLLHGVPIHRATLSPYELGYDASLKPYGYDPEKAKKLIAEAGYPNGFEVTLNFAFGGRVPMMPETAEMIQNYWEAVGIRTKLVGKETAVMLADRKKALKKDVDYVALYSGSYTGGPDPTHTFRVYLTSFATRPVYSHPEVDKLIKQALSTIDDEKREKLIRKAVKIVYDEVGLIPIFTDVATYGMKKNVDFTPTQGINMNYIYVKDMKFIE